MGKSEQSEREGQLGRSAGVSVRGGTNSATPATAAAVAAVSTGGGSGGAGPRGQGLQAARQRLRSCEAAELKKGKAKIEPLKGLKFSFLCLSGVDDSVSPKTLCDISQEFSFIEWSVNFNSERQGKEPRYASLAWLRQLREEIDKRQQTGKFVPIHFAAHLGGEYCVDVMKGDASLVRTLWEDYGFLRVQLSPTKAHGVNSTQLRKYLSTLKSVIVTLPQVEFVLEVTKETRGLSFALMDDPQPNLAFFFNNDELETRGASTAGGSVANVTKPISRPPPCPHPGIHVGYGGSLTVDNLREELERLARTIDDPKRAVWVDIEAGLRSTSEKGKKDEFDLGKVWACIRIIFDLGLPHARPSYTSR